MKLSFTVKWNINDDKIKEAAKRVLYKSMVKMQDIAIRGAPYKTGRLKASINLHPQFPGATEYILADGVAYGVHQEYGTYKMAPHPFMRPALDQVKNIWVLTFWKEEFG